METFGTLDAETADAVATAEKSGKATPKVVGKGLYLELVKSQIDNVWDKETIQIIITPAGVNEKGKDVPLTYLSRSVSNLSPRRQWANKSIEPTKDAQATLPLPTITTELVERIVKSVLRQTTYGYTKLQGKPLVVEVSNIDLTDIGDYSTPSALIRRIMKARTDAGFPADVYVS